MAICAPGEKLRPSPDDEHVRRLLEGELARHEPTELGVLDDDVAGAGRVLIAAVGRRRQRVVGRGRQRVVGSRRFGVTSTGCETQCSGEQDGNDARVHVRWTLPTPSAVPHDQNTTQASGVRRRAATFAGMSQARTRHHRPSQGRTGHDGDDRRARSGARRGGCGDPGLRGVPHRPALPRGRHQRRLPVPARPRSRRRGRVGRRGCDRRGARRLRDPQLARRLRRLPGVPAGRAAVLLRHPQRHAEDDADRRHRAVGGARDRCVLRQDPRRCRASAPRSTPPPHRPLRVCSAAA